MTFSPKLDARLGAAAAFIREGVFVSDVGTDHAYLPINLCLEGKIRGGVVSDINEGPIERARENIKKYGLSDKLVALRADGLEGIDAYRPNDIMILGMGGELIATIIAKAPWTKDKSIRLCLQPMTHQEILRAFLLENGFSIIDEALAKDDKVYQIILAEYSGKTEEYTEEELLLGKINIERGADIVREAAERICEQTRKRIYGLESAKKNADKEMRLLEKLQGIAAHK